MKGLVFLALSHARHHPVRSALVALAVGVAAFLPLATRVLVRDFTTRLEARAAATPLIAGAKGSRFDLVMTCLYFRRANCEAVSMADCAGFQQSGWADAIPLHAEFTARGRPLIGTTTDYFHLRDVRLRAGRLPARVGEAILSAPLAKSIGVDVGGTLFSDQRQVHDISKPAAVEMMIVGLFEPTGTPDDEVVLTDLSTVWVLEGLAHGHASPDKVPPQLVLDRDGSRVVISEELVDYSRFTKEASSSFHLHVEPGRLPITGVILIPDSEKSATLLKARVNAGSRLQVVVPAEAVGEMLSYVARVQDLMEVVSIALGGMTILLIALVTALSVRVRHRELVTLSRIGASRSAVVSMFAWEVLLLCGIGLVAAVAGARILQTYTPDLMKWV